MSDRISDRVTVSVIVSDRISDSDSEGQESDCVGAIVVVRGEGDGEGWMG